MTNKTTLTDEAIYKLIVDFENKCNCDIETYPDDNIVPFARAIEQATIKAYRQQLDNEWKLAVDRELTTIQSTADSYDSPAEAVASLIDWHVAVATDPTVNGGFKLVPLEPTEVMKKTILQSPEMQALKDTLRELISIVEIHSSVTKNNFAWAELDEAKSAIAAMENSNE